jgi:hypothetical protein
MSVPAQPDPNLTNRSGNLQIRETKVKPMTKAGWGVLMVVAGLSAPAIAQDAAPGRLANVKGLRCTFTQAAAGTWKKDGMIDAAVKPSTLVLRLEDIDVDSGVAQLRTGSMTNELTVKLTGGYLHFMQSFRTGPLYTTTVFENPQAGGAFKAVHSRHEYYSTPVPGSTSSPEQYYGECQAVG